MSIREMQNIIYQQGLFTFQDGRKDEGMVVSRYNIPEARVEYYFIPAGNLLAFQSARSHHDLDAHKKMGQQVDIGSILEARTIH
jgi:hypothetical protein